MSFPQLLVTPNIYRRKEVFQLARPYQILAAWYETHPDSPGIDEFVDIAIELGRYLQCLDGGAEIIPRLHEDYIQYLERVLIKAPHTDLLDLARTTLETGHDPYKLTMGNGSSTQVCEISDLIDMSKK